MAEIKIYHKPTCTTSRKAVKLLQEKNVEFDAINYYQKPFTKNKLKTLLKKAGLKAEDILRKQADEYKKYDFKNKKYKQDEIIELMIKHPDLIERPFIEKGDKAILARPVDKIEDFLKG